MAYVDLFPAGLADTPILRYISHIDRIHVTPAYIAIATDVTHTQTHTLALRFTDASRRHFIHSPQLVQYQIFASMTDELFYVNKDKTESFLNRALRSMNKYSTVKTLYKTFKNRQSKYYPASPLLMLQYFLFLPYVLN